jgi:glyoxylase-like metal-dependent hydrolase (beta-lactamase superfamily II)
MTSTSTLLHDLARVSIRSAAVSEHNNNVYLVTAKDSGAQVLIDAADDLPAIRSLLAEGAADAAVPARLELVATTHQHWDHVRALPELVAQTGVRTAAGAEDAPAILADKGVATDTVLRHGDVLEFGGFSLACVHLRGHTPGSIAFVYTAPEGPVHIFSGDSLFPGGVGNTWKDPERFASLYRDVVERLFEQYPDEAFVHPGHGAGTTLGAERPHLDEWKERGW